MFNNLMGGKVRDSCSRPSGPVDHGGAGQFIGSAAGKGQVDICVGLEILVEAENCLRCCFVVVHAVTEGCTIEKVWKRAVEGGKWNSVTFLQGNGIIHPLDTFQEKFLGTW